MRQAFPTMGSWKAWLTCNPWSMQPAFADGLVAKIRLAGLIDSVFGYGAPAEITIGTPYHESLVYHGINSRQRAVLLTMMHDALPCDSVVYASEQVTPVADSLRRLFPNFIGSEYLSTEEARANAP